MANAWTLLVRMQGDVRQMEYALSSVERHMGGLAGTMGRTGRNMSSAGRAMTIGLTAPILAAGGAAVKAATDFETSFTSVAKVISDADLKEAGMTLDQLSASLREMAAGPQAIPIEGGVNTLAEIMAKGGALGIPVERLEEFTEVVAKLSLTADDVSAEAAATSFGHLNTSLGFTQGEILETADAVVHLGNNGASTEGQILGMTSAIAGAAAIAGLSNTETVAWAASMANIGEKAQAGGSSLSRYFQNFSDGINGLKPDILETIVEVLDSTPEAVKKAFGEDPNQIMQDFMVNLSKMDPSKWTTVLSEMGLGDLLRRRGFTKMLNALREENAGSLIDMMNQVGQAGTAMETEYSKRAETLAAQVQVIMQQLNEAAISIGEALIPIIKEDVLPIIREGISYIQDFADWFSKLDEGTRRTALGIGILVAAAGPLMFIFGGLLQFLAPIVWLVSKLGKSLLGLVLPKAIGGGLGGMAAGMAGVQKVFVVNMPPGGMAPGGGNPLTSASAARGFWSQFARGAARVFGIAAAGFIGFEIGKAIGNHLIEPTVAPARNYETSRFDAVAASGDPERIANGIEAIRDQLNPDYWDLPTQLAMVLDAGGLRTTLEDQLAQLESIQAELKTANDLPKVGDSSGGVTWMDDANKTGHGPEYTVNAGQLEANALLHRLNLTTEMGLAGVGTSIERGITTGMDPVGDAATRLLARAENPLDPPIMREVNNHIIGLEELQASYIATGDWRLAAKVQENINTLHTLVGSSDTNNVIAERRRAEAASADAAMIARAERLTAEMSATKDAERTTGQFVLGVGGKVSGVHAGVNGVGSKVDGLGGRVGAVESAVWAVNGTVAAKSFQAQVHVQAVRQYYQSNPNAVPGSYYSPNMPTPYATGAWEIPSNQAAFLHAGEMVVPAKEAQAWRHGLGVNGSSSGQQGGDTLVLKVDGLMRVEKPSDLIRPMKHLARGKKMLQPRYGFPNG